MGKRRPDRRIEMLRGRRVSTMSDAENFDGPLDPEIHVQRTSPRRNVLMIIVDGERASKTGISMREEQFGPVTLRVGCIGGVGTEPKYRFKGYSRKIMENCLRSMRHDEADLSLLIGITAFYPKYGYAPVMSQIHYTMAIEDAAIVKPSGLGFVRFAPKYLKAVLAMYHKNNAGRTGPFRRSPATWKPFHKGVDWRSKAFCHVAINETSKPVGYIVHDSDEEKAIICEVGFTTPAVFDDLLAYAVKLAAKKHTDRVHFYLPEDDLFMRFCKPLGMYKHVRYLRDGQEMARMINTASALKKLAPLLIERMDASGEITLRTNLDDVTLKWSKGALSVSEPKRSGLQVRTPQWALAQMIYGYRNASEISVCGSLKGSKEAIAILDQMFPITPHFLYAVDGF